MDTKPHPTTPLSPAILWVAAALGLVAASGAAFLLTRPKAEPDAGKVATTSAPAKERSAGTKRGVPELARAVPNVAAPSEVRATPMTPEEEERYLAERFNAPVIINNPPVARNPSDPPPKTEDQKIREEVQAEFKQRVEEAKAASPETRALLEEQEALDRRAEQRSKETGLSPQQLALQPDPNRPDDD